MTLYTPDDIAEGLAAYQVSCGPAALAALLRRPVMSLRETFLAQGYLARGGYCNPTHMQQALQALGMPYTRTLIPTYGLLFLQWTGPWTAPGVPVRVAYRHTHWVATAGTNNGQVYYDINDVHDDADGKALDGAWRDVSGWEHIIARMITNSIRHADGGYFVRWGCQVSLPDVP